MEKSIQRFEELLQKFDHAMLVTRAEDGSLHARPMAIAEQQDGGRLSFATSGQSPKIEEILTRPEVAVVMQGDGVYLAIAGHASVVADTSRIRDLWSASWKLWFAEGPEDPQLALIDVEPERAEYWDRSGTRQLEFLWKAGKALVQGETLDEDELEGHEKLSL
ncbi:MAG: pyridoxamine 5'-phosphate oxidase family protein [Gammaproteobacteria bacterium]